MDPNCIDIGPCSPSASYYDSLATPQKVMMWPKHAALPSIQQSADSVLHSLPLSEEVLWDTWVSWLVKLSWKESRDDFEKREEGGREQGPPWWFMMVQQPWVTGLVEQAEGG